MAWYWILACLIALPLVPIWANLIFSRPVRLLTRGRWALIFEPADFWVGGYYDREKRRVFVILIPMLPVRYSRKPR